MPASEDSAQAEIPGQSLAVWAETLYLANLLLAPVLAFAVLLWLYLKRSPGMPALAVCHLRQAISASLWTGALLAVASSAIILLGGCAAPTTWIILIIYFTACHSTMVLLGVLGLARAMAGQKYVFPLVGKPCD